MTPTASVTAYLLPTATATTTPARQEIPSITDIIAFKNPYKGSGEGLSILVKMQGRARLATVRIYTASFRRVVETEFRGDFHNDSVIEVQPRLLSSLANGTYYYFLEAEGELGTTRSRLQNLIILK